MPTPVSSARQCLTDEAARALDDAVTVARRRSHSQTTSLHAVSALLSLPTSTLRDACARARSSSYSPRLQFRALELCVSVSLDRLPSSKSKTLDDEPPVSNSLMAAIKRSQANQRRHPETFHLYQMHQQLYNSQSSLSCVKVELKHFILSILDDPIVSRVFGDAGFRSTDLKIAILNPPISGFSKSLRFPPLFLCNSPDSSNHNNTRIGYNFPFAVDQEDEDFKRIGSILVKKTSKNPLLIGVSADTVLTGFIKSLDTAHVKKVGLLPSEIEGLTVIDMVKEISEFISGNLSKEMMNLKMNAISEKAKSCETCGLVVNFGDLKVFLDGGLMEYVVSELSNLVRVCGAKLWLIGSVGSYETYMKILGKFPGLEKDWDLNLLPITSLNGSHMKSILMGSFVPFGGFFPETIALDNSTTKTDPTLSRCHLCNEKYEHEVSIVLKGGRTGSGADQQSAGLASWLQIPESDSVTGSNVIKANDHSGLFNARVMGLERKWNDICHRLHHNPPSPQNNSQIAAKRSEITAITTKDSNEKTNCQNLSLPVDFFTTTSSSTTTSITTDLGLGTIYVSPDQETRHQSFNGSGFADFKQLYKALLDKVGYQKDSIRAICQTISKIRTGNGRRHVWLTFFGPDRVGKKKIADTLAEAVFGSRESLFSIDLNLENQKTHQGSIFYNQSLNFSDPLFRGKTVTDLILEWLTKKPLSVVFLENIDKADFLTQDKLSQAVKTGRLSDSRGRDICITDAIFVTTVNSCNESEDLNYSEEIILNAKAFQMKVIVEKDEPRSLSLLILPKDSILKTPEMSKKRKFIETSEFEILVPKVKKFRSCFDLNLSFDENEDSDNEDISVSDSKEVWLGEFLAKMDEKVVFNPFDFDHHSETILKKISKCFQKSFGTNVVLEIENEVMVQILAACWLLSDRNSDVENWIETVLYKGFIEVKQNERVDNESTVKLVAVEGVTIENDALCVCLPSKIRVK